MSGAGSTPLRARVFRRLLTSCERHFPAPLIRIELQLLLNATARGFGVKGKRIWHRAPERALAEYAGFTAACMERVRGSARAERLYEEAYALGRKVQRVTGFTGKEERQRLVFLLYRGIGIAMNGSLPGEITVSSCYFSTRYTEEQCALMSYMDSGVAAGICGGSRLEFTERLTEGCHCCRATLS